MDRQTQTKFQKVFQSEVTKMTFSKAYITSAWKEFANIYNTSLQSLNDQYFSILQKHGIVRLGPDGSVHLTVDTMNVFLLYMGEFTKYLQVVTESIAMSNKELYDAAGHEHLKNAFAELDNSFTDENHGLNAKCYKHRSAEYRAVESTDAKVGYSLEGMVAANTTREKYAAMFTDFVVTHERVNAFEEYKKIVVACSSLCNKQMPIEVYSLGLVIYDAILKVADPILSGEIMLTRKAAGQCPHCACSYKGIFNKKCANCHTAKEN